MNKIQCSVGILTFNNEGTLRRALESVKLFDDIVVCDGGSSDATLKIAEEYGCKIIEQDKKFKNVDNTIADFSGVRNQLLDASKYDWFLFIDSDEYFTKAVVNEIRDIVERKPNKPTAYWVPRKYVIDGEIIDCATTYPNKQMRFFNKKVAGSFIKKVHERIQLNDESSVSSLKEYMLVPLESDIKLLRKKWSHYIDIENGRVGDITFLKWCKGVFENLKVSTLYVYRFVRNLLFCRGKRMPFMFELERHVYHFKISKKQWRNVKKLY